MAFVCNNHHCGVFSILIWWIFQIMVNFNFPHSFSMYQWEFYSKELSPLPHMFVYISKDLRIFYSVGYIIQYSHFMLLFWLWSLRISVWFLCLFDILSIFFSTSLLSSSIDVPGSYIFLPAVQESAISPRTPLCV